MDSHENKYHRGHLYLDIDAREVPSLQSSVFEDLVKKHNMPLQAMVRSDDARLIGLLERSGFVLKRKCYEMDVSAADLTVPLPTGLPEVSEARKGTPEYAECAQMMYVCYRQSHAAVNPLTASTADFIDALPETVLYSADNGRIDAGAFIEGSEIAYLFSSGEPGFLRFAGSLLTYMFGKYDRIEFEADDTDRAATRLREMFSVVPGSSCDTYVKTPQ